MARDLAQRFNYIYASNKQPIFTLPEYEVGDDVAILQGLDGRKMSKSYGNTIPLFLTEKKLQNARHTWNHTERRKKNADWMEHRPSFDYRVRFVLSCVTSLFNT